jgi:hypothetical protein
MPENRNCPEDGGDCPGLGYALIEQRRSGAPTDLVALLWTRKASRLERYLLPRGCHIMAKLTEPEKHFIIEKLAQFCSHAEVVRLLKSELDVVVDRFQIRTLDPTHPRFVGGEKLRELFEAKRAAYLDHINDLPIASDAFRLRQLQDFFFKARDSGNMGLALKILKQAEEASKRLTRRSLPT